MTWPNDKICKNEVVTIQLAVTAAVIIITFVLAVSTTAKGDIDYNVSNMTIQDCHRLPFTSFFFPNATESELNAFFSESAAYCKEKLKTERVQP